MNLLFPVCLASLLICTACSQYLGCYFDGENRKLRGEFTVFPQMTPHMCIDFCKQKSYAYAGIQYGTYCFCGDQTPNVFDMRPESECNGDCPGDRSSKCGGSWRNSIYKTGEVALQHEYLGCYLDDANRKLGGEHQVFGTLNPRICTDHCKEKGYTYAGLQFGTYCFCGNETPDAGDKKSEDDCNKNCPGDYTVPCGGSWRNSIYKTEPINKKNDTDMCVKSATIVNRQTKCSNDIIFEESFDSLSSDKWSHSVKVPLEPDYQFVVYNAHPDNSYVSDGKLVIKPTLVPDDQVRNGDLRLQGCTGKQLTRECGYRAEYDTILPPVQTAQLTTRNSFSFRYGKVEIRAKLPLGDWLVPEISLEPRNNVYGPGYPSGKIRIAVARGNRDLTSSVDHIGNKLLESCILMGIGDNIRTRTVMRQTEDSWYRDYHNYTVEWTPDNIGFSVDSVQHFQLIPNGGGTLSNITGFTPEISSTWTSASKIAPFDNDFYISLGLSAGGVREFPDFIVNSGMPKPWRNTEPKAMLKFWQDRNTWKATWDDDLSALKIDHIKVTAL